jgi:hypothetical protein
VHPHPLAFALSTIFSSNVQGLRTYASCFSEKTPSLN